LSTHPLHTAIYTFSLHDALPIYRPQDIQGCRHLWMVGSERLLPNSQRASQQPNRILTLPLFQIKGCGSVVETLSDYSGGGARTRDRKSTRLNSSHVSISYAVFCL